jgi:hypothetical protein
MVIDSYRFAPGPFSLFGSNNPHRFEIPVIFLDIRFSRIFSDRHIIMKLVIEINEIACPDTRETCSNRMTADRLPVHQVTALPYNNFISIIMSKVIVVTLPYNRRITPSSGKNRIFIESVTQVSHRLSLGIVSAYTFILLLTQAVGNRKEGTNCQ